MAPRNVRNFFITGEIDGRKTPISTGPSGKEGEFQLVITMREKGQISDYHLTISGYKVGEELTLSVWENDTRFITAHTTER